MKKTFIATLVALVAFSAYAQDYNDGLSFSQNDYYGTARTIAMGNAFTALGGDTGSIGINPAGSAVNKYSQFTITPGVNISMVNTKFGPSGNVDYSDATSLSKSHSNFVMPNFGAIMTFDTGRRSRLKRFSIGFVCNATNYFNEDAWASGTNNMSSMMSSFAATANSYGITASELNSTSFYDLNMGLWAPKVGYHTAMINPSEDGKSFYGTAEGSSVDLDQRYERVVRGGKYDFLINVGFDYEDIFFFGANLGLMTYNKKTDTYFDETPVSGIPVTIDGQSDYFRSAWFGNHLTTSGTGVYGKFGLIYVPFPAFRMGVTVQTPTAMYLRENMWVEGETTFDSNNYYSSVPEGDEYIGRYKFVSPMRLSIGAAYNFGMGVISADYEVCNYSEMKFKNDNGDESGWTNVNDDIVNNLGAEHNFRLGAEFRVNPRFALRAGYNFKTSPFLDSKTTTNMFSAGAGYSSNGSFFCDFACRLAMLPTNYYYPYESYGSVESPETSFKTNLLSLVATLGWRF